MTDKPAPVSGEKAITMRRKALEHWRSYSQRLKYRVVILERELSALRAENERWKASHAGLVHDEAEQFRCVEFQAKRAEAAESALAEWRKVTAKESPAEAAKGIETLHTRWKDTESALAVERKDAERYRWLRAGEDNIMLYGRYYGGEAADAAIDAVLNGESK